MDSRICSFETCSNQSESLSLCGGHYAQTRRGEELHVLRGSCGPKALAQPENVLWIAGLFEGEGCVTIHTRGNGYAYPKINLGMSDEDVVVRFRDAVGFGVIARRPFGRKKDMFYWSIAQKGQMLLFLRNLLPFMGTRRASKFLEAIQTIEGSQAELTCQFCVGLFIPGRRGAKYCSIKCRKKANR